MLITTTPNIDGKTIQSYHGLVTGEAILGANIFKDFFAGIRDIVGGRSSAYEKELKNARTIAMDSMMGEAYRLKCNAIIGVDIDYETIGMSGGGNMLMVSVTGTAVKINN